jgi:hypothetical protein
MAQELVFSAWAGSRDFSLLESFQIGFEVHPVSCLVDTGTFSLRMKW